MAGSATSAPTAGVKRAALVAVVTVPLLLLLPLHVALFGVTIAAAHSIFVFLVAAALLDGLFLTYRQFPFACSYVPIQNPKVIWPTGVTTLLMLAYGFADLERWALQTAMPTVGLGAVLVAVVVLIKVVDQENRREPQPVNFDLRPTAATQRLGLFDHAGS